MLRLLRFTAFCLFLVAATPCVAAPQYAFRITFRDKSGSPSLSDASSWLSPRSIARRNAFGISLDATDQPVSPLYLDSVLALNGAKLHTTSRWLNQCVLLVNDSLQIPALRTKPWISKIELVGYFPLGLHKDAPPAKGRNPKNEPLVSLGLAETAARQAGSSAYYSSSYPQTNMVHGDTLHDQGLRGKGKLIAVLDAGFAGTNLHPGFDSMRVQGRLLETYNFVYDTSFVYSYDDHGTNCLSAIAGLWPGKYVGTAPDAQYALYVTEDATLSDALYELDNMVAGMERADSLGVDIISSSIGYNTFVSPYVTSFSKAQLDGGTTIVAKAANLATAKGILVVTSAGNEGGNTWNYLLSPSDADSALTVGAVNTSRGIAGFSSPGPNAKGRIKPEVCLQGDPAIVLDGGGAISNAYGTSFSTPQAAGYAACLMQAFPTLPPAFIRQTFEHISHLYPSHTDKLGYGIPDFRKAQRYLAQFFPESITSVTVLPNPFEQSITVRLPTTSTITEIALCDVVGRSNGLFVQQNGSVVEIVPPATLSSGLYFLNMMVDGKRHTHKLLHR